MKKVELQIGEKFNYWTILSLSEFKSKKVTTETKVKIEKVKNEVEKCLSEFKFNEALKSVWDLIGYLDGYISNGRPWEWKENASQIISDCLLALDEIAELLNPFMPETSDKIKKAVAGQSSGPLFPRIDK